MAGHSCCFIKYCIALRDERENLCRVRANNICFDLHLGLEQVFDLEIRQENVRLKS